MMLELILQKGMRQMQCVCHYLGEDWINVTRLLASGVER